MSQRTLRLAIFALLAVLAAYAAINIVMAWGYIYILTHQRCVTEHAPIAGIAAPQEIELMSSDGVTVRGWYYPGQNGAALLALGGPGGSLGSQQPPVKFLIEAGYGVLQIDSRRCARPPAAVTLGAKEVLTAAAGLEFLKNQPGVEHIGVIGFSMGGVTAIRTAARYPQIEAVVAEGGFYNMGDDFVGRGEPKSIFTAIFLHTVAAAYWVQIGVSPWEVSPIDDLPTISPRPVFLIYGEKEIGNGHGREQYEAALQPKTLWVPPGGSHGRNHAVAPEEYERRVLEFFGQYLLPR